VWQDGVWSRFRIYNRIFCISRSIDFCIYLYSHKLSVTLTRMVVWRMIGRGGVGGGNSKIISTSQGADKHFFVIWCVEVRYFFAFRNPVCELLHWFRFRNPVWNVLHWFKFAFHVFHIDLKFNRSLSENDATIVSRLENLLVLVLYWMQLSSFISGIRDWYSYVRWIWATDYIFILDPGSVGASRTRFVSITVTVLLLILPSLYSKLVLF